MTSVALGGSGVRTQVARLRTKFRFFSLEAVHRTRWGGVTRVGSLFPGHVVGLAVAIALKVDLVLSSG